MKIANPSNIDELSGERTGGLRPDLFYGSVDCVYQIDKCEETNGRYTNSLNTVAAVDTGSRGNRINKI